MTLQLLQTNLLYYYKLTGKLRVLEYLSLNSKAESSNQGQIKNVTTDSD